MSMAVLTAVMSEVGKKHPDLLRDRQVSLFIELCIAEAQRADRAALFAESAKNENARRS